MAGLESGRVQIEVVGDNEAVEAKTPAQDVSSTRKGLEASTSTSFPMSPPTQMPQSDVPPDGSRDDDGPDYL